MTSPTRPTRSQDALSRLGSARTGGRLQGGQGGTKPLHSSTRSRASPATWLAAFQQDANQETAAETTAAAAANELPGPMPRATRARRPIKPCEPRRAPCNVALCTHYNRMAQKQ